MFYTKENIGPTQVLVFQPTSFCNIDCSYCYLPNRQHRNKMSLKTVERSISFLIESKMLTNTLSILWHVGEPLAAGMDFYRSAFNLIKKLIPKGVDYHHSIQTNGILINDKWCSLFKEYGVQVGISIDGPQFINDKNRLLKNGKGSFELTLKGLETLKRNKVEFSTIAVLSYESLSYPEEIFNFFHSLDSINCGFNIEEVDGANTQSSLQRANAKEKISLFYNKFYRLWDDAAQLSKMREFKKAKRNIYSSPGQNQISIAPKRTADNYPFRMITILHNGDFSTYSPEFIDININGSKEFVLGNVYHSSIEEILRDKKFIKISEQIEAGIEKCSKNCEYFDVCGGGAPTNKYFENGSFDSMETMFCQLNIQVPMDVVLKNLEEKYELTP